IVTWLNRYIVTPVRSAAPRIPKGFRPKAQGCEARATLGKRHRVITTLKGLRRIFFASPSPTFEGGEEGHLYRALFVPNGVGSISRRALVAACLTVECGSFRRFLSAGIKAAMLVSINLSTVDATAILAITVDWR